MMPVTADQALRDIPTRSLVIDTNILLLLVVGSVDPDRLGKHKRTRSFAVTPDEWQLLEEVVQRFRVIRITPTILAEASNLLGNSDVDRAALAGILRHWVEVYEPSQRIILRFQSEYLRLGLTDASMMHLASQGDVVLTDDALLYLHLCSHGWHAMNFTHLRLL